MKPFYCCLQQRVRLSVLTFIFWGEQISERRRQEWAALRRRVEEEEEEREAERYHEEQQKQEAERMTQRGYQEKVGISETDCTQLGCIYFTFL